LAISGVRSGGASPGRTNSTSGTPADERIGWLGTDWDRTDGSGGRVAGAGGSTEAGGQGWGHAAAFYERTETAGVDHDRDRMGLATATRRVGPWLAVHAVFVLSALATVWFTYTEASRYVELSVPTLVGGVALFGTVLLVSTIHILSRVYR